MILPSDAAPLRHWGPDQDRLHRHLLRHPDLLPRGARLLVALSGGQDSMALTHLLINLRPLHGWQLTLWHGDHGWRDEAAAQGEALATWAATHCLALHRQRAEPRPGTEAEARHWRYACLRRAAETHGCRHVLTGHTASDRAETLLLNLARGSHRRGLAALRPSRTLASGLRLVRPLLPFSRQDTGRICQEQGLPVWTDVSNADLRFSRNRLRAQVLPVLEDLHPGAATRIAAMAERLAQEDEEGEELLTLALTALTTAMEPGEGAAGLARRPLMALQPANQRRLLQAWLRLHWGQVLQARALDRLLPRLSLDQGPGRQDLARGWQLRWDGNHLILTPPPLPGTPDGDLSRRE